MTFEDRNASWTGKRRSFVQSQTRSSAPRVWTCEVRGNKVFTTWGQKDGAQQPATDEAQGVNLGKKNEVSPEDYALYLGREKCRKKHWEGYREVDPDTNQTLDELVTAVDFDHPPLNLAFWKPDNNLDSAALQKKAEAGAVWYVRKMNGLMHCVWTDSAARPFITTRRMLRQHDLETGSPYTWDHRYPHIIERAAAIMPPKSCVCGDLVVVNEKGIEDLAEVEGFSKSLTPKALEEGSHLKTFLYVWDIPFWDGEDFAREVPLRARYELIKSTFNMAPFFPVHIISPTEHQGYDKPDHFRKLAELWGWEGFVVVDPDGVMGDRAYNFKGKPDRPAKIAAKLKPVYEDDFIAYFDPDKGYGEWSTKGRYGTNGIKAVSLYQVNSKGELVYIANCSSGMTEEMKSAGYPTQFPRVWQVEYTNRRYKSRGDDTNALDFPRFKSERTDKKIEECVNPEL